DGWTATPPNVVPCFNHASWNSNGFVALDGADDAPSCFSPNDHPDHQPNSWISKSVALPTDATTLEFDVAGHNSAPADSELRIRFVKGGVSTTVLDWTTILGNQNTDPDAPRPPITFSHKTLDIS